MKTVAIATALVAGVLLGVGCGPSTSGQSGKPPATATAATATAATGTAATATAATTAEASASFPTTRSVHITVVEQADGGSHPIGELEMDPKGYLTVVTDDAQQDLKQEAHNLNQIQTLNVEAACPEGSPKYALCSRVIERGSPDTLFAVKENLSRYEHWTVEAK